LLKNEIKISGSHLEIVPKNSYKNLWDNEEQNILYKTFVARLTTNYITFVCLN